MVQFQNFDLITYKFVIAFVPSSDDKRFFQNETNLSFNLFLTDERSTDALNVWAPSSEFVSSSIPSWQILTAHAQPFRGARDLAFCLKVSLDSLLVWASSGGSGETARMRRLAWTFAARIDDKYQIRLARPNYSKHEKSLSHTIKI